MQGEAEDIVCLEVHEFFGAIGFYYRDFRQVSDDEVIKILMQFPPKPMEGRECPRRKGIYRAPHMVGATATPAISRRPGSD
jgi:hypothetical protein